jgi:hypothetical protein
VSHDSEQIRRLSGKLDRLSRLVRLLVRLVITENKELHTLAKELDADKPTTALSGTVVTVNKR